MTRAMLLTLDLIEIRENVKLELDACKQKNKPWYPSNRRVSRQINFLIITYVSFNNELGIAPYGDMLLHLGWPGQVIHELFCKQAGMWEAFRKLVERSHGLPWRTPLVEGSVILHSLPERFVYRALIAISGVTHVDLHPCIPGGSRRKRADFLVTAASGLAVYIEVAMVTQQGNGERPFLAEYREDLLQKVGLYQRMGLDPIVIWADEAASPRMLAERLNDIRARLGLPTRPPAPPAWYEEIV